MGTASGQQQIFGSRAHSHQRLDRDRQRACQVRPCPHYFCCLQRLCLTMGEMPPNSRDFSFVKRS